MSNVAEHTRGHVVSIKDPKLYKEIMCIASDVPNRGFDLEGCRSVLEERGFNISYQGLVYKAVQVLVRSNLLKRDYSAEKKKIVYRLAYETNASMI